MRDRPWLYRAAAALATALIVLAPHLALGQGTPVYQNDAVVPDHLAKFLTNGRVADVGGLLGDVDGNGVAPFAILDKNGPGLCSNTASTSGTYRSICLGHSANGDALVSILGGGKLIFDINGTLVEFPGTGSGNVVGAATTVVGRLPAWGNTTGSLLSDPGTAYLDAAGLSIGVGVPTQANVAGYALQVQRKSSGLDSGDAAGSSFFHNDYTGTNVNANVNGSYSDLWYEGTSGNQGFGSKSNAYTYTAGSPLGSLPNQYFNAPNIGTLTYLGGVYGRAAHYLPGTITHAAAIVADGLYNISSPAGGAVTNSEGVLIIPPYVAATNNYGINILSAACSPNCFTATINSVADPIKISAGDGKSVLLQSAGVNLATFSPVPNTANNFSFSASATGNPVRLSAVGDANVGIVLAPGNTSATVKVETANFQIGTLATPASAGAACSTGTIEIDTGFAYICTAPNTWKRAAFTTW
jgi:hypothetical protein